MAETTSRGRLVALVLAMVSVLAAALVGTYVITNGTADSTRDSTAAVTVGDVTATDLRVTPDATARLQPGDLVTLNAEVTTSGASSLWMRTFLDVSGIDPALAPYLSLYNGPTPSAAELAAATDITDPITFPGYVGTADALTLFNVQPFVLNGTSETEAAGISTYPVSVAVYVDPQTPTDLLARPLAESIPLTAIVQSFPYRTHPDIPDGDLWNNGPRLPLG